MAESAIRNLEFEFSRRDVDRVQQFRNLHVPGPVDALGQAGAST